VLARIVGVVSQETYLVHASIRENLLLAAPDATEAELWRALGAAQVADLVASLPDGLDTLVGARGHRFSGGEQQRLAIARTILRDPRVLVLDEATSALDNDTERALQDALDTLIRGRTTITIAHRLSTIEDADEIAVLDHGRVIERGTHRELVEQGGRYAALAGFAVARAWRSAPRPVDADDLLPERALAGDPLAKQTLIERIYRPLQAHSTDLVTTLWSYLDNGRSLEATARELFVHPNTVRYRLKRVSEVIGWDATGPREALILQTALILGSIGAAEQVRRRPPLRRPSR
jgi:ABC-type multidrug transport system ATPase subunit